MPTHSPLTNTWKTLYTITLPHLAKTHHPAQPHWPVKLDHCFARIILDNTIGKGVQQWDTVIQKPAIKHMTETQLMKAIELGEQIMRGEVNLEELDMISLKCRGKNEGKYENRIDGGSKVLSSPVPSRCSTLETTTTTATTKRRTSQVSESDTASKKRQSVLSFTSNSPHNPSQPVSSPFSSPRAAPDTIITHTLSLISSSNTLTPFRKRLYTTLLSIPSGHYTTYSALSTYLSSSPRAIGSAIRNNPFAPVVPCHRVLAADGSIGGFGGSWGREGMYAKDKVELLRGEGVRFDEGGKVKGVLWREFHEFEGMDSDGVRRVWG